ncbi:MAG: hypothetical protein GY796_16090 [Chloroflexi bacterium]|nr:hypothetical protein [Chloroflexota bacterium]
MWADGPLWLWIATAVPIYVDNSLPGNAHLKYAYWDGVSWQIKSAKNPANAHRISLALSSADKPHIAYFDIGFSFELHYHFICSLF